MVLNLLMVKFKSRYLLIETLYEGGKLKPFDTGKIALVIKNTVSYYFGDIGVGKLNKNLQVKYMNNYTNMLIIRVGKENLKMLWTAVTLINNIDEINTRMHVIGVSGSIKKCEQKAKRHLEQWLIEFEKAKQAKETTLSNDNNNTRNNQSKEDNLIINN